MAVLATTFSSPFVHSKEGEGKQEEKAAPPGAVYYNLSPPFIVSIKGEKRLRFLKVDISLRFQTKEAEERVTRNMPQIRNDLIMLLSSQPESALVTTEGKEKIRQDAFKKIQDILTKIEGSSEGLRDLLFMNFVIQN